jgi:hypothetical protein
LAHVAVLDELREVLPLLLADFAISFEVVFQSHYVFTSVVVFDFCSKYPILCCNIGVYDCDGNATEALGRSGYGQTFLLASLRGLRLPLFAP